MSDEKKSNSSSDINSPRSPSKESITVVPEYTSPREKSGSLSVSRDKDRDKVGRVYSKKEMKAAEKQEKRRIRKLDKCRKKIDLMSKNSSGPRDLVDKFCAVQKKYEEELQVILAEETPTNSMTDQPPVNNDSAPFESKEPDAESGLPRGESGKTWSNSIETQKPSMIWHPTKISELVAIVTEAEKQKLKVRPVGTGYSFNKITSTDDWLADMTGLKKIPTAGEQFLSVQEKEVIKDNVSPETLFQVEAGIKLEQLNNALMEANLAMLNVTSYHGVTLAGAISTGSHGSGRFLGCISDFIKSIDIVVNGGKIYRVEPTDGITDATKFNKVHPDYYAIVQNDKYFNSLLVSMGTMGLIYSVILRVERKYWLAQSTISSNWSKIIKLLTKGKLWNEKKQKDRSCIFISPYGVHPAIICSNKYLSKDPGNAPADKRRTFSNSLFPRASNAQEITSSLFRFFPNHTPELIDLILKGVGDKVYTDLSYKVLNFTLTDELLPYCFTIEVAFAMDSAEQLITQVEKIFALIENLKRDIGYVNVPLTLHFVNKSNAYMALSNSGPVCIVEISCLRCTKNSLSLIKRIEEQLIKNGGIPHWGLRFLPIKKEKLKEYFPLFDEWSKVFAAFNGPYYTFSNIFTDELFLEVQSQSVLKDSNPPIETTGPFKQESKEFKRRGLVRYNPQDLQRDFPHIAKGSYGVVFKGRVPDVPLTVAIKDMDIVDSNVIEDWKKELTVMNQSQSPYVVEVYGYTNDRTVVTIVMEYMARGDLFNILHKKMEPLSILQRLRMARHCALGLALLHHHHIIHRDVKSLNILVTEDYSCKLTDFGCAKLVNDRQIFNTANSGTPLWMAPEVKRGQYTFSADIFSVGLVFYELFERKLPGWDDNRKIIVLPNQFQSYPMVVPCVNPTPERRPTAVQVVKALDNMIIGIVESIKVNLPKVEQEILASAPNNDEDDLENDLVRLYKHLLSRSPEEVDNLINKSFGGQFPAGKGQKAQSTTVGQPQPGNPPPYGLGPGGF